MTQEPQATAPEFSVLISCYYEEKSIEEFHTRLSAAMNALGRSYEIIITNDGSLDNTWAKLKKIQAEDSHVVCILDLFRNSGQQAAVTACLNEARGRAFIFMDSDLQLSPEEIPVLVAAYDEGYDLVSGYRTNRQDPSSRIIPSKIANVIMRKASGSNFRDFGCTFKIYNAALVRAFDFGPYHVFSNVEAISRAGRCREVPIMHSPRKYGKSGWTFQKLWRYNMNNLVSLSDRPFQYLAVFCFIMSLLFAGRVALNWLTPFQVLASVPTGLILNFAMISLLIIVGVLSILGEFTVHIFQASRRLPFYIVREKIAHPR